MPPRLAENRARKRAIAAWCLYDWSATPFHSVINTFVFSVYFSRQVYGDETAGSAAWAYATGAAGLAIALLSPLCGAIADRGGGGKSWIGAFTLVNMASVGFMWFVLPDRAHAGLALWLMMLATIGGEMSLVFYNALLPGLASREKLGLLSGVGWGIGYAGGLAALGLVLAGLVMPPQPWFGIPRAAGMNLRAAGPFVALWTAAFAWPLFVFVPERPSGRLSWRAAIGAGISELKATLRRLPAHRGIMWFLISSALYRDGLTTLFTVGGQYAAGTFGMNMQQILEFAIGINLTAILGCAGFGRLDDRIGAGRVIALSLGELLLTGAVLVLLRDENLFIPVALVMGLFIGPAQSASRSLLARLAPPEIVTEMFGLYQFAGRSVSFLGPLAFGAMTGAFGSQRAGMASVLLFIAVGLALMRRVRAA